ncbi:semaphorin-2A [Aplysia californica]|uniref:Semaphorin-2A n=1 Tax=Aplysia californica TaxID=6500 RepID=A0ABM0JFB4_APLCA|nr:semaphorin-2A [Aplysia californica]
MCATGAYSPIAYQLKLENNRFNVIKSDLNGIGICPYDPYDNTTVIFVENGAPGNIPALFAASVTDSIKSDPIIVRPSVYSPDGSLVADYVRTIRAKNDWLNEPQFVGSFDVGDHVYFFYREVALEYTNCGKKIYSRLARVCKNDYGGSRHLLQNIWTSFVKARLNCSIPGEYPYYFDEIQDVYRVGDMFYGLFTTNINGLTASAICGFTIHDIDQTFFNGSFKEQRDLQSIWLPVPEVEVPSPRPGDCKTAGARSKTGDLPYKFTNFVSRSSMLMDRAIPHRFKKPIFYQSNCLMQKLVVVQNVAGHGELVFVTASNDGVIYKIAAWPGLTTLDAPKTYMVSHYIPFSDSLPIWSLTLYKNWIYFGTDWTVGQIHLETCGKYKKIDLCIYDPYCGWDTLLNECRSNERKNLINYANIDLLSYSLEEAIRKQVGDLYYFEKMSKISGSSVTLKIEYRLHISGTVHWKRNGTLVSSDRHILAQDNSLIVTDLRKSDEGLYSAVDQLGRTVAEYSLAVETSKEQIEQRWMRKFDQWCDEFERYQEDIRQWERKCSSCCQGAALTNMVPALGGK